MDMTEMIKNTRKGPPERIGGPSETDVFPRPRHPMRSILSDCTIQASPWTCTLPTILMFLSLSTLGLPGYNIQERAKSNG